MDREQAIVFIQSQCVCAQAEIEAMKVANVERALEGAGPKYGEKAFLNVVDTFGIGYNSVSSYLRD